MGQKISIRRPTQLSHDEFPGKRPISLSKHGGHRRNNSRSLPSPIVSKLAADADEIVYECCTLLPRPPPLRPTGDLSSTPDDSSRLDVCLVSRYKESESSSEQSKLVTDANDDVTGGTKVVLSNTGTFSTTRLEGEPVLDADVSLAAACDEALLFGQTYYDCPSLYGPEQTMPSQDENYETMTQFYTTMRRCGRHSDDIDGDHSLYGNVDYLLDTILTVKQNPSIPKAAVQSQQDQTAGNDVSRVNTSTSRSDETRPLLQLQQQQQEEAIYHNIPPHGSSSRRPHVRLPLDSCSVYKWKFLSVTTFRAGGADSDTDSVPSITVVCSKEQADFPPLADGCSLLHGSVVHFLPHNQTFTEPIFVSIEIPSTVPTSRLSSLSVYYSPTSLGGRPAWRPFRSNLQTVDGGALRFEEEQETTSGDLQRTQAKNSALVSTERHEVLLSLRHFCIFAIVVDGRREIMQKASVIGFLKIPPCGSSHLFVNVLLLLGCCQTAMAENESLAILQGYTKVQNETIHIYESGGNIQVSLDFIDWIDKATICGRQPVVHRSVEVWNGSTKTYLRIKPPSAWVEQAGFNSNFFATLVVKQDGKEPVTVTIEEDLHKLLPPNSDSLQSPRLPFCVCTNCLQPPTTNSSYHRKPEPVAEATVDRMTSQSHPDRNQGAAAVAASDANVSSTDVDHNSGEVIDYQLRSTHSSVDNEKLQSAAHSPNNQKEFHLSSSEYAKAMHDPTRHESRQPERNLKQLNDDIQSHQLMQQKKDKRRADDDEQLCHLSIQETTPVDRCDGLQRREEQKSLFNWCN